MVFIVRVDLIINNSFILSFVFVVFLSFLRLGESISFAGNIFHHLKVIILILF